MGAYFSPHLTSRLSVVKAILLFQYGVFEKAVLFPSNQGLFVRSSHQYFKAKGIGVDGHDGALREAVKSSTFPPARPHCRRIIRLLRIAESGWSGMAGLEYRNSLSTRYQFFEMRRAVEGCVVKNLDSTCPSFFLSVWR